MNPFRQFLVALWAVGLSAGLAAGQGPYANGMLGLPASGNTAAGDGPSLGVDPGQIYCPCSGAAPIDRAGLIGGVGIYLIQPYFQNNPAYTVILEQTQNTVIDPKNPNTQTIADRADRVNVSHHLAVAPLLWLGYIGDDGFGARARWWGFQQGTSQTVGLPPFAGTFTPGMSADGHPIIIATGLLATVTSATPLGLQAFGDTLGLQHGAEATNFTVTTQLNVQVVDLEAIQGFRGAGCNFLVAGGLRVARLLQTYNAYDAQSASAAELRSLLSSYTFTGLGPTLALETRRPLGDSGLSLYSLLRGSLVAGSAQQNVMFSGQELRNDDPNPQFASQHRERALPIAEVELGTEYGRGFGRSWLFGQIALVGQEWFGAGSASRSTMQTPVSIGRPVIGGASLDSNIAFFGLSLRIGVNY